jgi:amino acid adenylation domain-containing protein
MLDEAAFSRPEAPAVRCDGSTLTYGELARGAYGVASVLLDSGLSRRDRVAVLLGKGLNVPIAFYGVLAAGGVLVPIDPKSPPSQIGHILRATGATHLVTEPQRAKAVAEAMEGSEVAHVIGVEPGAADAVNCLPWAAVSAAAVDRPPDVAVTVLDPCYILHTSGSTGTPKLILHTHRSAMSFVDWAVDEYDLQPDDRLSNHSSHHTCFATFDYYAAARVGASTVIVTPAALMMPASLATLLEQEQITIWYSVPTALVQLSLRGDLEGRDLDSMRWVLFAGETFPEKHLRRLTEQLPAARFSHVYGSTETNVCTYYHLPVDARPSAPLPIGRPCSNSSTVVVDADLEPVPDGGAGELLVRGSTVMSGYWQDDERNRQVLVRPSWAGDPDEVYFRTGDRVQILDDGNLAFVAREDLQVKIRGHRVELGEVETALLALDEVDEAAAVAVADAGAGAEGSSTIRAVVVLAARSRATERELIRGVKNILPPYAVPSSITRLESMPRTPTGKVDRRELGRRLANRSNEHDV